MPFSDLLDTVEITLNDSAPLDDSVEITLDANASLDDSDKRSEPTLAATPLLIEFDEPARLDPRRVGLTWELPSPAAAGMRWRSSLSALAVHVFPLLLIIGWPATANEVPVIPVQLVLEQPPPPAAQPPQSQPQPQPPPEQPKPGRLASEDLGEVKPKDPGEAATTEATPAAGEKQQEPTETQTAMTATPPPLPPPKPPKDSPAVHPPKPSGAVTPHHEETPHEAPRAARFAGPASSRDEYLAYLVTLTREHIDLLPMTVVGTRRGETVISVTVKDDGTISHISVYKSSGYADIDERIEQMVSAVHKFPPVPQWFQGNSIELELTLRFPEALERD